MGKRIKLRIGSRGSDLAKAQARLVVERFAAAGISIEPDIRIITTSGDRAKTAAALERLLRDPAGRGVFVKEIDQALLQRKIDIGVHSVKDIPTAMLDGLCIGAVLPRAEPNDLFVGREIHAIEKLPAGALVGTSSPRRRAEVRAAYPQLRVVELRGNLDTRMARLMDPKSKLDGILVAAAAFRRLYKNSPVPVQELPLEPFLPAPGQGAIGVTRRESDEATARLLERITDPAAAAEVAAERALLGRLQAGCSVPLGALARTDDSGLLRLSAVVADPETGATVRAEATGEPDSPDEVAAAVEMILKSRGGLEILQRLRATAAPARRPARSRRRR